MNNPRSIFTVPSPRTPGSLPNSSFQRIGRIAAADPESLRSPPATPRDTGTQPSITTTPGINQWEAISEFKLKLPAAVLRKAAGIEELSKPSYTTPNHSLGAGLKRSRSTITPSDNSTSHESISKKPKLGGHRPQYKLYPFSFTGPSLNTQTPPSPLFFSSTPRPRPSLPPRFSSSEAAVRMLSKTREDSGIKTVTLARGSFNTGSPPSVRPSPRSRPSAERISTGRFESPDPGESSELLGLLGQIGVTELLDQDDRPTFIIDLGDPANHNTRSLNVVYANTALRSCVGLLDIVSGKSEETSSNPLAPLSFPHFRSWILSASSDGESLDVCLPAFVQDTVSWSCSTLRKRLRIASGTLLGGASTSNLTLGHSQPTSRSGLETPSKHSQKSSVPPIAEEPQDYFGSAVGPFASTEADNARNQALPNADIRTTSNITAGLSPNIATLNQSRFLGSENFTSYQNECVLSAATAGDVDHFGRVPTQNEVGFFDWTRLPISDNLPPHIQFARTIDWANTALGPIENWTQDLRQMCNLIMASPHPAAMYWGDDLVAIYNEAYVVLAGQKHPTLMGQSYREAWREIWDDVKDVFANAQMTGQATMKDDDCLFINRQGFLEEAYFSWSIIPLVGSEGSVVGLYNPAFEKTRRKIAERRMLTLREIGERTAAARDVKSFWEEVLGALECNEHDTPFVLLYSISDDMDGDGSSVTSSSASNNTRQCYLEGALGVPEGHPAAPDVVDLRTGMEGFVPMFREVLKTNKPTLLDTERGDFSEELVLGMESRGFGDDIKAVVVCPIHPTTDESTLGFLVMGVNPRRPYDDDYSLFIQLLSRQLATSLASVVLFEEEIRRGQRAAKLAALDRIELSEQLAARTQEAIESETKFTRMAEFAPVGMFIADSEGRITFSNDTWYEITRVPRESQSTQKWINYVMEADRSMVLQLWHDLIHNAKSANAEFRFKAPSVDRQGARGDTWVLFSAYPERYDDGTLKGVFGSITNISQQKWAEGFQKRKMEEAVELKRQQENFIDITSHEMRNPLSAILQCADEIASSLSDAKNVKGAQEYLTLFNDNIDAAQTIALCAQHQKRIVDDVLTLSKLDSALLIITPVDAQPLTVVQRALKMFEGELQNADIRLKFIVSPAYKQLGVDWVRFDPSRILQVLINLTTNAIKFTTTEKKRTIIVTLSASVTRPSADEDNVVKYFPTRAKRIDMTEGSDWGDGDEVYIHFAVEDTGRGLSVDEMKTLFLRFSQASPRTHVQYGGSGLGLFISRELTELQGGEIGVASEAGKGSTFAFYVKARRSAAPNEPVEQLPANMGGTRRFADNKSSVRQPAPPKTRDFAATSVGAHNDDPSTKEPLKILIVEDNLVNQRVLQKQLRNIGCITYVANHGGEALDKLRESTFWVGATDSAIAIDVICMDVEMPIMNGLTCTKHIREFELESKMITRHVPIIAVTANARAEQIKTATDIGVDDIITKPFRIPDLISKIKEILARDRQQ